MTVVEKVAMTCTLRQFNTIRKMFKEEDIVDMYIDFDQYPFLTNNFRTSLNTGIGTHNAGMIRSDVTTYTEWDADLFLRSCGLKENSKPKEYDSSNFQYYNTSKKEWESLGGGDTRIRFKPKESQLDLQIEVAKKTCINIVTCGNCGSTLLHRQEDKAIECPDCGFEGEPCDFPDLNY